MTPVTEARGEPAKADAACDTTAPATDSLTATSGAETRRYLRGSSLLLGGRGVSLLINFAVQVTTVRYLSKSDYGAFMYALGVASLGSSTVLLGLDKSVSRFIPMYQERGEEEKAFGTIHVASAVIWGLAVIGVLGLLAMHRYQMDGAVRDPQAYSLLLILIALAPLTAFDALLQNVLAIFVGPRAIFFRRHVLGPGLKLLAVLVVIAAAGSVTQMAWGYLIGSIIGVVLYIVVLLRTWRATGKLHWLRTQRRNWPAREVLAYTVPLALSDLAARLPQLMAVIFLEHYHTTSQVAEFRAVLPVAQLNQVVFQSFSMMYIPLATRLFERGDGEGINRLYWTTALWISVLTFPVFIVSVSLATPVTVLLFGAQYATAATSLMVLAVGCYVNAAFGFNSFTLRVQGRTGPITVINTATAVVGLAITIPLTSAYGAIGAAIGSAVTLVLHNVLTHVGLLVVKTGVSLLDWRFLRLYALITVLVGMLLAAQVVFDPPIIVGLVLAAVASLVLVRASRRELDIETTFPRLLRVPLLSRLFAN